MTVHFTARPTARTASRRQLLTYALIVGGLSAAARRPPTTGPRPRTTVPVIVGVAWPLLHLPLMLFVAGSVAPGYRPGGP